MKRFSREYSNQRSIVLLLVTAILSFFCVSDSRSALTTAFAQQAPPDSDRQLLFRALDEMRRQRFPEGRAVLKPLTVPNKELMPVAFLINADSLYREGGSRNLGNARVLYRVWFELFPDDKLAPEVMLKISEIDLRRATGNQVNVVLAEKTLLTLRTRFPEFESSAAVDYLEVAQETLADHNLRLARYYLESQWSPLASLVLLEDIVKKRPRFTRMDEALWHLAVAEEADENVDERLQNVDRAIEYYGRIVRDYPNSVYRNRAENRLILLGRPVPEPDPRAMVGLLQRTERMARVKAELQDDNWSTSFRGGILLNERDQADWSLIDDLIRRTQQ